MGIGMWHKKLFSITTKFFLIDLHLKGVIEGDRISCFFFFNLLFTVNCFLII